MTTKVTEIVNEYFDELNLSKQYRPYIQRSKEAGYSQLAKVFEALSVSESVREKFFREKIPHHAVDPIDFFVCPHCGLIYDAQPPDQCLVDQTPGDQFIPVLT